MATLQQKLFKKIVLHNKLLDEPTLDGLLAKVSDPEKLVAHLVKQQAMPAAKAKQLLALYHQQLAKHSGAAKAAAPASAPSQEKAPAAASGGGDFDSMMDDVLGTTAAPPQKPGDSTPSAAPSAPPAKAKMPPAMETSLDDMMDDVLGTPPPPAAEKEPEVAAAPAAAPPQGPPQEPAAAPPKDPAAAPPKGPLEKPTAPDSKGAEPAAKSAVKETQQTGPAPIATPGGPAPAGGKALIHHILGVARELGASDVHITAGLPPVVRIASRLQNLDLPAIPDDICRPAILELLDPVRREVFEEHNDLDFCYDGGEELGRFRTNLFVEQSGSAAIFRLISAKVPSFEELNLPEQVKKFTDYRVGIVLITGPKSCGKTTTLAAMVDHINRSRSEHVITIEDPIEFVHPHKKAHVSQREVGTHTESFGNALRAALREAPDVIMVGEMRDLETTSLAITAAETGHLVLATLHTPDAVRTIGRVLDVFPPKEQGQIRSMLSESLRGIVSQQLVPTVDGKSLALAVEILVNTPAIGNMIREDRTFQLRGMMQTGKKRGMILMDNSLVALARDGQITVDEAIARAAEVDIVRKDLAQLGAQSLKT